MGWDSQPALAMEIVEAVQRATRDFKRCPNRIRALAGSLPERERMLLLLIPPTGRITKMIGHEGHDQCTFDFCEYSRLDFTSVAQRHESPSCSNNPCERLQNWFPKATLDEAVNAGNPTAWKLDGKSMIEPPQRFMAISHVWSDGTETGAWLEGEVNKCLYSFFRGIAEQFQCEGIWWDTICIPREKGVRSKAINRIQKNYEDARFTLVHDCFLRNWEWVDAETACFAIIVSSWFSRGWTSLELAKSRKVKVVFKGPYGPLIKDLDEDILAKADDPSVSVRHRIASEAIATLRSKGITEVNELLTVLGPRHTSWPRDIAIISGLLVGVEIPLHASQQDIYQRILRKMAKVSHTHLFHNSATMSKGFSWCSASLLDMPIGPSTATLRIEENGDVIGTWKVFDLDSIPEEKYMWKDTDPLIKARLQLALIHKDEHVLLVEPQATSIARALVVKAMVKEETSTKVHCQYIGPVYFHPPLTEQETGEENRSWIEAEVRIGDTEGMVEIDKKAWDHMSEVERAIDSDQPSLDNVETGERRRQMRLQKTDSNDQASNMRMKMLLPASVKEEKKELPLPAESGDHRNFQNSVLVLAAANGDVAVVQLLLDKGADPNFQDKYTWTALHHATWGCYDRVVQKLIERADPNIQDRLGQQALHLAAERGNEEIVRRLLERADLNVQCKDYAQQTVLHRAAWGGSKVVVGLLLLQQLDDVDAQDKDGRTALHVAAENAYSQVVRLLLDKANPDVQDSMKRTALHIAAQNGNEEVVELLLEKSDPTVLDKDKKTALHIAAEKGYTSVVKLLVEEKAEPNIQDSMDQIALPLAAQNRNEEVLEVLLEKPKFSLRDSMNRTALHLAARNGHEAVIRLLLEKGADVDAQDNDEWRVLQWAAYNGHEVAVRLLLEKGADVNAKDNNGWTALKIAAENGREVVVQLLLENGANVDAQNDDGWTALHIAAENGHEVVVRLLLEKGADVDEQDDDDWTALHIAAQNGHEVVVRLLLEKGANINARDDDGGTVLHIAAQNGHKVVVRLLLEKGANVDEQDDDGWTALHIAAQNGYNATVQLLVEKGADIKASNWKEETALHIAAQNRLEGVVQLLLETGADVNAQDSDGWTALHKAAAMGHNGVVQLLIKNGADIKASNWKEETALHHAAWNKHEAVVRLLLEKGANIDVQDNNGWTALHIAAWKRLEAILRLLLEKGASANVRDNDGWTALQWAAWNEYEAVVRLLIQKGADVTASNHSKETALRIAAERGHRAVARLLVKNGRAASAATPGEIHVLPTKVPRRLALSKEGRRNM